MSWGVEDWVERRIRGCNRLKQGVSSLGTAVSQKLYSGTYSVYPFVCFFLFHFVFFGHARLACGILGP